MNEQEYVQLNDLLTKYKVKLLKMLADKNITSQQGRNLVSQLRSLDRLRNNIYLELDPLEEVMKNE